MRPQDGRKTQSQKMQGKKSERIVMQRKWFRQEFVICGENDSWWLPCVPHNTNCAIESSQMKVCNHTIPQMKVCNHTILYHRWRYASIPNHTTDEGMRTAMEFEYFLVSPTPQLSLSWFIESSIQVSWTDSGWLGCNLKLFSHRVLEFYSEFMFPSSFLLFCRS